MDLVKKEDILGFVDEKGKITWGVRKYFKKGETTMTELKALPGDREYILDRAKECVNGQRHEDYGSPEDNFGTIAKLWSLYSGHEFTSKDVSVMMILMKIARIKSGKGTEDCFIDIAGYAACGGELFNMEG